MSLTLELFLGSWYVRDLNPVAGFSRETLNWGRSGQGEGSPDLDLLLSRHFSVKNFPVRVWLAREAYSDATRFYYFSSDSS